MYTAFHDVNLFAYSNILCYLSLNLYCKLENYAHFHCINTTP